MIEHKMALHPAPFSMIASGRKTIELRLNDEKRKRISIGDIIRFTRSDDDTATIVCRVTALHPYSSFEALYRALPLTSCGYTEENVATASPKDMDTYYTKEEQEKYGVMGIEIKVI